MTIHSSLVISYWICVLFALLPISYEHVYGRCMDQRQTKCSEEPTLNFLMPCACVHNYLL